MYRSVYFRSMQGGYHDFFRYREGEASQGVPVISSVIPPSRGCLPRQHYHHRRDMAISTWSRNKVPVRCLEKVRFPSPEKARVSKSAGKQMYIMFCDRRGMILCHAVPTKCNVNADYYSKVFLLKLFYWYWLQNKWLICVMISHTHTLFC